MKFEKAWEELNKQKKIDRDVKLTPEQFKKQVRQFYMIGYKECVEETERLFEKKGIKSKPLEILWKQFEGLICQFKQYFIKR